jgi:hypothetical protein
VEVACVLRSGGQYGPDHVRGLAKQVSHYMPQARFACLSDVDVPCERVALETTWPGWFSKIELFRHFRGRTLYLDLDTVLLGDASHLVSGEFTMIRNWVYQDLLASGVMAWDGDYSHIADAFEPIADRVMAEYVTLEKWGDQAFIAEHAGNVKAFPPGAIASYRFNRLRGPKPPKYATIVAFNGSCVPWRGPNWARKWWQ